MNDLQFFTYKEAVVRTIEIDGEVWFMAKDVCDVLGLNQSIGCIKSWMKMKE